MGCRQVSSRIIAFRLRAIPFNITVAQAYVPTSDYSITIYRMLLMRHWRTFLPRKESGMQKWARMHIYGPFCNDDTNERGLRFLDFATFNDLVLANTFVCWLLVISIGYTCLWTRLRLYEQTTFLSFFVLFRKRTSVVWIGHTCCLKLYMFFGEATHIVWICCA